jgi:hypothetical protein
VADRDLCLCTQTTNSENCTYILSTSCLSNEIPLSKPIRGIYKSLYQLNSTSPSTTQVDNFYFLDLKGRVDKEVIEKAIRDLGDHMNKLKELAEGNV